MKEDHVIRPIHRRTWVFHDTKTSALRSILLVISIAKTWMVGLILCEPFARGGSAMQVFEAVKIWLKYHKANSREKTLRTYRTILLRFRDEFRERNLESLTSEEILSFLGKVTDGTKPQMRQPGRWLLGISRAD
jgi:hypothetical protein